jgi:nucleoside-diphosphate-sugar epimerase
MKKKVLVLGGSYFAGRVFCMLASQREDMSLFVVNRGRYTLNKPHIAEFKCERHDIETLVGLLPPFTFDAVIDFCAYEPLDIDPIIEALGDRIEQYIYLSTSSVYDPQISGKKTEDSPLLLQFENDVVSQYVIKKALLELDLSQASKQRGIEPTTIRPAFIYGPYNYAPRESYFIKKIVQAEPVPVPIDATAKFSFVYVADVAKALLACIGDSRSFGGVFNLAGPEDIDYPTVLKELENCNGAPFATEPVTVAQVLDENIALPFPLSDDELYSGQLFAETFDFSYTPFSEGMVKAFKAFKSVYTQA